MQIIEENNKIALMHYQPVDKTITVEEKTYRFEYRNHVALAWVDKEDVGKVLLIKKKCCGDQLRPVFQYANQNQVLIWKGEFRK